MKRIKRFIYDLIDKSLLKEENKELKRKLKEYEDERKPLIDLKNKYLSELRCKNLEIGRLRKQLKIDK